MFDDGAVVVLEDGTFNAECLSCLIIGVFLGLVLLDELVDEGVFQIEVDFVGDPFADSCSRELFHYDVPIVKVWVAFSVGKV